MPSYGHEFLQKILNFVEMSKNFGKVISQSEFLLEIVPETTQTSILVKLVRVHSASALRVFDNEWKHSHSINFKPRLWDRTLMHHSSLRLRSIRRKRAIGKRISLCMTIIFTHGSIVLSLFQKDCPAYPSLFHIFLRSYQQIVVAS